MKKKIIRKRRAKNARKKIENLDIFRLSVYKTAKHIYSQIFSIDNKSTIVSASTIEKKIRKDLSKTGSIEAAKKIGRIIAKRAIAKNIKRVAFDRSGFKYHGKIKILAESAREFGLKF
ncbi:50S ribosomal protein L18 [bacterium endosymbiont of Pedicinus badii]|uniref:50S ribosomal protein L18 n=1 Tax=bacterium endosymbiont of Pedicinus badii TaxID=1719126 RepID=UPI0009BA6BBD|nr:50S ribosomal protein L18 [bacterium endosymbiont of Pedicinus badii]OQM34114.1 50S ribosomal protein L18 [bacterium endosymbiont of Pedicinus badii]